jgi:Ca2+-binding RTX toxin-like protein
MSTARSAVLSTTLLTAALALSASPAHAEPLTCQGKPVTVEGTTGTPGDDVMVVGLTPVGSATGGAGNDLICIRLTTSREPLLYSVDAGPGDDSVVNESTAGSTQLTTVLGAGADTYAGSDTTGEIVVAGAVGWSQPGDASEGVGSDVETDTIDTRGGLDIVYSGSTTAGEKNRDGISLGDGNDRLHWAGEQVGSAVDLGGGSNGLALYPGWQGTSAVVDAGQRIATVDSRPALRWTGEAANFQLGLDNLETTFTGTDAPERLLATTPVRLEGGVAAPPDPAQRRMIDMGGGDDQVELRDTVGGTMIGGAGRDTLDAGYCLEADVKLGSHFTCLRAFSPRVEYTAGIDAWEDVSVPGGRVQVVGTDRAEEINARGLDVRINGLGGADRLIVDYYDNSGPERGTSTVRGGRGADLVVGNTGDDRLVGGQGNDRLEGLYGKDTLLGGTGRDRLFGGRKADRLVGGSGRDKAVGEGGRDRCSAEVRRSCERR